MKAAIHIASFWALAIAGPVYDVLRRNREFFVAHRAGQDDILLFAAVLSIAAPAALAAVVWLLGRASAAAGRAALAVILGVLAGLLAAQALQALSPPAILHLVVAGGSGALAAVLYSGTAAVRSFATWLAPAIAAFPLVFLFDSAMRPFVWPQHAAAAVTADVEGDTPIVLVVLDQLPLTSLVEVDGSIDPRKYPGFSELAGVSTWFRNATTVGDLTTWALPPIVSGDLPSAGRMPIARDYPHTIFSALGGSYDMEVFEPITALCPEDICEPRRRGPAPPTLAPMVSDAAVVALHIVAPPELAASLPPLTENWKGFADAQGFQRRWASERERDRRRVLDDYLGAIERADPARTLYFLHALLPHEPYEYLPTGQRSGGIRRMRGVHQGRWTAEQWPVVQTYARHLLQVRYVDGFIQRLLARLRSEGLLDRALIAVTADHGVSFIPGRSMKGLDRTTARNIVPVPLFVKRPFQTAGGVSDRNVQSIDVLPMVADILDVDLPFETDGQSPLDPGTPAPASKTVFHAGARGRLNFQADEFGEPVREMVAQRNRWFGEEADGVWTPRVAPAAHLRGRALDEFVVEPIGTIQTTLENVELVGQVDPAADAVPAVLAGRVRGALARSGPLVVAVAVNGRIAATTSTHHDIAGTPDGAWTADVHPGSYRTGANDVRVLIVRGTAGAERLVEAFRTK